MDTSIEDTIKERFVSFYKAMNYWYLYCNNLEDDETLTDLEITNKQKEEIKAIFDKYCTNTSINIDMEKRIAILEVEIEDALNSKYQYILKKCREEWLIDSRKRYSNWKKKWVIEGL